jgi:DNA-binding response OmpR family regulator
MWKTYGKKYVFFVKSRYNQNMSEILLLEDDKTLGESLKFALESRAFKIEWAKDIASAKQIYTKTKPKLLILDWNLPDGTGYDWARLLRENHQDVPIIFLTARIDEDSAVKALSVGANDFVRKPFGTEELLLRIKKCLKESVQPNDDIRLGDLRLKRNSRDVTWKEKSIKLNRKEFDILELLMRKGENIVTREDVLAVIDTEGEIVDRTVDSHISHIRKKLKDAGAKGIAINTEFGVGYRLEKVR